MSQYLARHIADVFESIAPLSIGNQSDELGFVHGDPQLRVNGIACMWNMHSRSLQRAIDLGANMLIVHERIWYPHQESDWYDGPKSPDQVVANINRRKILDENNLVIYRSHSNWDALPVDGVPDQAVAALGIEGLKVIGEQKYFKVHEIPESMTLEQLGARAKAALELPWVRLFGDPLQSISRFSFLIGGFGENQWHMPQVAGEMGAQAVIIGEMGEFEVLAAQECGMGVIETLHSASEIPAIKRQAQMMAERFPDLPVHYVDSGALGFTM